MYFIKNILSMQMELPARGLLPEMIHTSYKVKLPSNKISRYLSKWERSIENLLEITLPVHRVFYTEFFWHDIQIFWHRIIYFTLIPTFPTNCRHQAKKSQDNIDKEVNFSVCSVRMYANCCVADRTINQLLRSSSYTQIMLTQKYEMQTTNIHQGVISCGAHHKGDAIIKRRAYQCLNKFITECKQQ